MKIKTQSKIMLTVFMLGFIFNPLIVFASDQDIVITEIGAYENSNYEWIEIHNNGLDAIDLTGWKFFENDTDHGLNEFQGDLIIEPDEYAIIADVADNFIETYPDFDGTVIDSAWTTLSEDGEEIGLKNPDLENVELFTYLSCSETSLQRIDLSINDYSETNWMVHELSNSIGLENEFNIPLPCENFGDINVDGFVDDLDLDLIREIFLGNSTYNTCADYDLDGVVTQIDIVHLSLKIILDQQAIEDPIVDPEPTEDPDPDPDDELPEIIQSVDVGSIIITEFVADPVSGQTEWIELYNKNNFSVDLSNWKIFDGSQTSTRINTIIGANQYLVIENPSGKLNNSGDIIILQDEDQEIINQVVYGDWEGGVLLNAPLASDPNSVARVSIDIDTGIGINDFMVTQTPTKGSPNQINLIEEEEEVDDSDEGDEGDDGADGDYKNKIIINEIFPNPEGSDLENEWVELKNISQEPVDLAGWQIQDYVKKNYEISMDDFAQTTIAPNDFLVIERSKSLIALNNDKDTVKLYSPDGSLIQTVKYKESVGLTESSSYAFDLSINEWAWTIEPTMGEVNIINILNHAPEITVYCPKQADVDQSIVCDATDSYDAENDSLNYLWEVDNNQYQGAMLEYVFKEKGSYEIKLTVKDQKTASTKIHKIKINGASVQDSAVKTLSTKSTSTKKSDQVLGIDLTNIRSLEIGTKISTQGTVSVLPGTFSKSNMYVSGSGIQVYMYKGDWPKLKLGDYVDLKGILSQSKGETRINLKSKEDIQVIGVMDIPEPQLIEAGEVGEEYEGSLVQLHGQIIEISGSRIFISDDSGETVVYIKKNTQIKKSEFKEGDVLDVVGIVSQNNEEYQVLPRSTDDMVKEIIVNQSEDAVVVVQNSQGGSILKYLILVGVGLMLGLVGVAYKQKNWLFKKKEVVVENL